MASVTRFVPRLASAAALSRTCMTAPLSTAGMRNLAARSGSVHDPKATHDHSSHGGYHALPGYKQLSKPRSASLLAPAATTSMTSMCISFPIFFFPYQRRQLL
ncbi:hypothetical protein GQ42DRAFT_22745 [Ramicandelaber brevisporus]|nr:hypothetical protein GQ42DRAFT_22745 [Ramicandelaber brevisporus]